MTAPTAPAISVIVPMYNVEPYLEACLDSLLTQMFGDFEVVVVDDGSTDGSRALAEKYVSRRPDVFRIVAKHNGGLADARNAGMKAARGAWLAFVDADDIVAPEYLSAMHACAAETGADLVICGIVAFADPAAPLPYLPEPDISAFGHSLAEEPRLLYRVDASACDKLYARDLFQRARLEFPVGTAFEDVPTTYRLLASANQVEKVDLPLYRYRQGRVGSITQRRGEEYLELVTALRCVVDFYSAREDFASTSDALLRLALTHLIAGRYPDLFLHATGRVRSRFLDAAFQLLDVSWPEWRGSEVARSLWPRPLLRAISTHQAALHAFCELPAAVYLRLLARLGAFDATR